MWKNSKDDRNNESGQISIDEFYNDVAVMCFRDFNFNSFEEVDKLTFYQIELLLKARALKEVDLTYHTHLGAWLSYAAQSTEGSGKNIRAKYGKFKKFFDYDAALKTALREKSDISGDLADTPLMQTIRKILGKEV